MTQISSFYTGLKYSHVEHDLFLVESHSWFLGFLSYKHKPESGSGFPEGVKEMIGYFASRAPALLSLLIFPCWALAVEDRPFTESIVIFNTICAKCHEAQCTESTRDFLEHFELTLLSILHPRYNSIPAENRMGDTLSLKITNKVLYIQHLVRSRYDSTDLFRLKS